MSKVNSAGPATLPIHDDGFAGAAYPDHYDDAYLTRSTRIIKASAGLLMVLIVWAWFAELDEVSVGNGKVIPISREQIIQSQEGGILASLNVAEGDIVDAGQILAQLDPTRGESSVEETSAKYRAMLASAARLQAAVDMSTPVFPKELAAHPELIAAETRLFRSRLDRLNESLAGVNEATQLVRSELAINESLAAVGAASNVEVIRLKRQRAELALKATELRSEYIVQAREELAKVNAEVVSLASTVRGRSDLLTRLTIKSPVRGVVKDVEVTTIGGVIPPNGQLMQIVPLNDQLLIEARISPRDIAFIHPGQSAKVKITAYDYSIYGGLEGKVSTVSPDTIQDQVKPEVYYYRVYIRTETDSLQNKAGKKFAIVPGMIATVDIKSGQKTVLEYLLKPFNKAQEALRER